MKKDLFDPWQILRVSFYNKTRCNNCGDFIYTRDKKKEDDGWVNCPCGHTFPIANQISWH